MYKKANTKSNLPDFGSDNILRIILKLAPPVMLAQLIQAMYNLVDSFFVGRYSGDGLTALSIIYPIQLLMIAFSVGTGVGINALMAHYLGIGKRKRADECAGTGAIIAIIMWIIFAVVCYIIMPSYADMSTNSASVAAQTTAYGRIVSIFSIGLFAESVWTKVLQAEGDMETPMAAQIAGALINVVLDPIFIWGWGVIPEMGISGAAYATVIGQIAAALIVMKKGFRKSPHPSVYPAYIKLIYKFGFPNILMQSAYTFYILGLNLILKGFSDQAVTVLGLYYKWQTFFFIPLGAMQTCIVPILSYNYAARKFERCAETLTKAVAGGMMFMFIGTLCFELIPQLLLEIFSNDIAVFKIGLTGFRIIGLSFVPMSTSLIFPVFFQAIGSPLKSSVLTVIRTVALFVPLGWLFSKAGLQYFWLTFPVTEVVTSLVGVMLYKTHLREQSMIR